MDAPNTARRHPIIGLLTRLLEMLLILAMGTLVVDVLWGVLSRALASWGVLASQSSWTEELARYLMIWVGLLGACLAFEKRAHLGVDYFVGKFHASAQKLIKLGALLVVLLFAVGALIVGGWELVSRTLALQQYTPALGIPKAWVYLAVPISGVFTVIFTLGQMVDVLREGGGGPSLTGGASPGSEPDGRQCQPGRSGAKPGELTDRGTFGPAGTINMAKGAPTGKRLTSSMSAFLRPRSWRGPQVCGEFRFSTVDAQRGHEPGSRQCRPRRSNAKPGELVDRRVAADVHAFTSVATGTRAVHGEEADA